MRKLILFVMIFILIIYQVSAARTACLTNTDSVASSMLNAFGLDVTTSCTSNFANYNIVVDFASTAGIRAAAVPALQFASGHPNNEWDFTDGNADVEFTRTTLIDGANPGTINTGVAANPTVYSSGGDMGWIEDSGSTPVVNNDAYDNRFAGQVGVFWWDTSDTDATGGDSYEQKGVYSGLVDTSKWNDEAKRIFNNSVAYVCPFCADACIPPSTGNWDINVTCNVKNKDYNITGNVSIFENGFLNLTGSGGYLNFVGSDRYIFIYPGGELSLDIAATIGKDPIT